MATSPINVSGLLSAFGLGGASNMDVSTIVSEIMTVNEQPLTTLQNQITNDQSIISTYGTILSSVSNLQNAVSAMQNTTVGLAASSSNTSAFTATAASGAVAGTTAINISNIATAQTLYSTAYGSKSSAVADLTENPTQYLQIQSGSNSSTIKINSGNNTLSGIQNAINNANVGVTASIVQQASNFVIGPGNNTINFNYGSYSNLTATVAQGTYSGSGLASAIANAMNQAVHTAGDAAETPFSANYNASNQLSITNTNSSSSNAQINWASGTLTPQQLGFMPDSGADNYDASPGSESSAVAANGTITGNAVDGMYALLLTSNSTGAANGITVKADESSNNFAGSYIGETGANTDNIGLSALASNGTFNSSTNALVSGYSNLTQTGAAADAKLTVGGISVTSASNTVTNVLQGVTLNLLQGSSSGNLTVSIDSSSLANKLSSLVSAYNSTMATINTYASPVLSGQTATQTNQGILSGDLGLMTLSNNMRGLTTYMYGIESDLSSNSLPYIGITHDKSGNGTLQFDSSKLSSAYQTDSANITAMINNMVTSFGSVLNNAVSSALPGESKTYQTQVTSLQNQANTLQSQLNMEETSLISQYAALENLVTSSNNISNFLTEETNLQTKGTAQ